MGLSMFGLSKVGQVGMEPNPQMKMMLYVMPVMMTFLFLNFASGLNLYYAVSNIASIPQQWMLARERQKRTARVIVDVKTEPGRRSPERAGRKAPQAEGCSHALRPHRRPGHSARPLGPGRRAAERHRRLRGRGPGRRAASALTHPAAPPSPPFVAPDGEPIDRGLYTVVPGSGRATPARTWSSSPAMAGCSRPARLLAALHAAGARPAAPGEFTRRAVLNGKLDLVQAEAVGDLIDATAPAQARAALRQLDGGLSPPARGAAGGAGRGRRRC